MSKMRMIPWLGLAMSAALVAGCVAAPSLLRTSMPNVVGETYADNTNPPEYVKAIPVGEEVSIPRGKAAMTLFVVIPQKQAVQEGDRKAQYINFSNISRVDVTITGENLANPVTTSINVSSGSSAAGTVVLNAGRNQIITAVGRDGSGNVVSTVKGVATSLPGQVVNAEAKFGTTPLADVIGGLNSTIAPELNMAAVNGIINPILSPSNNNGAVTYGTHPTFINPAPIINAVTALVSAGAQPGSITTVQISDRLSGAQPIFPGSTVTVRLRDPKGNVLTLPNQGRSTSGYDRNNDGIIDGSYFNNNSSNPYLYFTLSDPITPQNQNIYGGQAQCSVSSVPPGEYLLTYWGENYSVKPWEVLPLNRQATTSVAAGTTQTIDVRFADVSRPVTVNATGSFSSGTYNGFAGYYSYEWFRFPTKSNLVYHVTYEAPSYSQGEQRIMIFDQGGAQLYQNPASSGSFTFASAATNSLYVYTRFVDTRVDVITETLGANQSLYNATVNYGQ